MVTALCARSDQGFDRMVSDSPQEQHSDRPFSGPLVTPQAYGHDQAFAAVAWKTLESVRLVPGASVLQ